MDVVHDRIEIGDLENRTMLEGPRLDMSKEVDQIHQNEF